MKSNSKRTTLVMLLSTFVIIMALVLVPAGRIPQKSSKPSEGETVSKETTTEAVVEEDRESSAIELVKKDNLQSYISDSDINSAYDCDYNQKVVSNMSPLVYIYKTKDAEGEKAGVMLPANEANIIEIQGDWTYVEFAGCEGYVQNETVLFGPEALCIAKENGNEVMVIAEHLTKVYESNNTGSVVKTSLGRGMEIGIVSQDEEWTLISYGEEEGYVATSCIGVDYKLEGAMTIEAYEEYLAELERKRLAEEQERERQRREAAIQAGLDKYIPTVQGTAINLSAEELWLLACIIKYESGWEPYEGKLAVANVVLNRYKQGYGSVASVIYAKNQFSGVSNGSGGPSDYFKNNYLDKDLSYRLTQSHADECMKAAIEAAAGINNIGDYRFFISLRIANFDKYSDYKIIGGHVFYSR